MVKIDKQVNQDKNNKSDRPNGKRKCRGNHKEQSGSGKLASPGHRSGYTCKEACKHCDKWHAVPDNECWTLEKNKSKKPRITFQSKPKAEKSFVTQEEVCKMISELPIFKNAAKSVSYTHLTLPTILRV